MRLYVGNLAEHATEKCLQDLFGKYGIHGDCSIIQSNKKAFAIVHVEEGEKAIADLDGRTVEGTTLRVLRAVDRSTQISSGEPYEVRAKIAKR